MDVFAIERCHERAVEPLDDPVREEVAFVLDFLDFVGLPRTGSGRHHFLEEARAALELIRKGLKVAVELLFPRDETQSKRQSESPSPSACAAPPAKTGESYQIRLHGCYIRRRPAAADFN